MNYFLVFVLAFVILLGEHFIPWAAMAGREQLHRVEAYVIGTATTTALQMAAVTLGAGDPVVIILTAVVGAGAGTVTGYGIDWVIDQRRMADRLKQVIDDAGEREQMLKVQRDE